MNIQGTYKGKTYVEVTIENLSDDRPVSDDFLKGYAVRAVGMDVSSLFDMSVTRWPMTTTATVTLHTD